MASITTVDTTDHSIKVKLTSLDPEWTQGTRTIYWYVNGSSDGTTSLADGAESSGTHTFSGLSADTTYTIKAVVKHGTSTLATLTKNISTDEIEVNASYTISNITGTTAKLNVSVSPDYTTYCIHWRKTSESDSQRVDRTSSTNFSHTLTGLDSGTEYTVNIQCGGAYGPYIGAKNFTTVAGRPSNFAWTYAKVADGNFNLTATEWNAFTTRINEFLNYKGLSDSSFTTATSGAVFTAAMYNQARTAMRRIQGCGTSIPLAETGEIIEAYHLNKIVADLNAIT